ncbi:hypothetical protein [Streptomyces sp. enrichment culture]|uniref:hypothetical protein n=1 Tax=Streptomyces sp. enrichment culture TaxID=1795815 RepID=UPI003F5592B4
MDLLINFFVGVHVIGIAALLGGFIYQLKAAGQGTVRFAPGMLHGALVMLVSGLLLTALNNADDVELNNTKIGLKMAVLLAILTIIFVKRSEEQVDKRLFGLVGLLTLVNIFTAVLWT